jgi:chemotaxis protein MotB
MTLHDVQLEIIAMIPMWSRTTLLIALAAPLLTACVSQSKYDAVLAENQQFQAQNQQLQAQVAAAKSQVGRLQNAIKYTVNSDQLFKSGSWDMSPQGEQIIAKMASQLASTQASQLVVNGYTDNAPIGAALKRRGVTSNLELSQKRADAVMQYLISQGVKPELVSAQGHGDSDPVAPNTTPKARAQNRRVEITLASPSG